MLFGLRNPLFRPQDGAGGYAVHAHVRGEFLCQHPGQHGEAGFRGAVDDVVSQRPLRMNVDDVHDVALALAQASGTLADGQQKAAAGDIQGALAIYRELTETQPDSYEAFAHLGGMQLLDQRYSDAVKSFQQAISLGDDGRRSFIGMGMAYLHMGQLGPARAAFVEARDRGTENSADVDGIISWIDSRQPQQ